MGKQTTDELLQRERVVVRGALLEKLPDDKFQYLLLAVLSLSKPGGRRVLVSEIKYFWGKGDWGIKGVSHVRSEPGEGLEAWVERARVFVDDRLRTVVLDGLGQLCIKRPDGTVIHSNNSAVVPLLASVDQMFAISPHIVDEFGPLKVRFHKFAHDKMRLSRQLGGLE